MSRKKANTVILIFVLLLSGLGAWAQTPADLFYLLPAKICFDMTVETRKTIVSEYMQNGYIQDARMFKVKALDIKNGYFSLEGGFEGTWEMCVWNLDRDRRMVGVCFNACGPVCRNKFLVFYLYADGKLALLEQIIIPKVEFFEFFRDDARIGDVARFYNETHAFTYHLPRSGKNIACQYEWSLSFEDAEMKKFVKGEKMDLIWNGGEFSKGPVHW